MKDKKPLVEAAFFVYTISICGITKCKILGEYVMWDIKEKDIDKQSVFWNMMSSGLNSVVSMFLLLIVTRICGVADAGIFSLGFSTAQMMLTIGNYGMRNYQATDIKNKYAFGVYRSSRIITNILMLAVTMIFILYKGYYLEKALITFLLCVLKATDAVDDIFGGNYQKKGRLDISGKIMSIRIIAYVIAFCIGLFLTKNLVICCCVAIIVSSVTLFILVFSTKDMFDLEKPRFEWHGIFSLLKDCFPLCISAFLLIYMGNAPKYAIDLYLSNKEQAYYTYLFMPCFVTNLFVGFALQPLLVRLSSKWIHKEYNKFLKLCGIILAGTIGISIVIVVAGGILGCPILSVVFNVGLNKYRNVLVILLIGGGFFALAVVEQVILTVMRKQKYLLIGFVIASVTAMLCSNPLVNKMQLLGAGMAYTVSAVVLCIVLGVMIFYLFFQEKKNQ